MCSAGSSPGPVPYTVYPYYFPNQSAYVSLFSLLFIFQDMADGGGGVIATERYGSQEAWRYRIQDGGMRRERMVQEQTTRGKSITDAFKVRHRSHSL